MKIQSIFPNRLPAIITIVLTGSVFFANPVKANDFTAFPSAGSFHFLLAQSGGGFFKRLAEKNRQKKAQRQALNNQIQQSNQVARQSQQNGQNQWNWLQGQNQTQSRTRQTTQNSGQNQWNWFQGQNQTQSQNRQTTQQNTTNPFGWQQNHRQTATTQQAQQTNSGQTNFFQNRQNQNVQQNTQGASSSRGLTSAEITSLVNYHNQVRAEVGVGPVRWSPQIANHAQQWADELARTGQFRHRPKTRSGPNYGENIGKGTAGFYTPLSLAKSWAGEKRKYPRKRPFDFGRDYDAAHYTQMVWRNSTLIGAGKAISNGQVVVVCNYSPAGNVDGQNPY